MLSDFHASMSVAAPPSLSSPDTLEVELPRHPIGDRSSSSTTHQIPLPRCDAASSSQLSSPLGGLVLDAVDLPSLLSSLSSASNSAAVNLSSVLSSPTSTPVSDAVAIEHVGQEQASQPADEEDDDDIQQVDDINSEDSLGDEDIAGDSEQETCSLIASL
jgi:hypothetical protein